MLDNAHDVLKKYVGDMAGVVRHVHEAVDRQLASSDSKQFPQAREILSSLSGELNTQRSHLDGLANELDAEGSKGAKEMVTALTGFVTGLYDHLRNHPISKDLRDDYVALTMCCVAYEMLHATGLAVKHEHTADLALRHLRQLTPYVTQIGQLIPHVVVEELSAQGVSVDGTAAHVAAKNNHDAWALKTSAAL